MRQLSEFLVEAKTSTYAAGDNAKRTKETDQSTTMIFEKGDWKYHDNYFGGEPYGGREVVLFQWKPIWMMTYYGWVEKSRDIIAWEVYRILQWALRNIPECAPYRGPLEYRNEEYVYHNSYAWNIEQFSGKEIIKQGDTIVYQAQYMGGIIDQ